MLNNRNRNRNRKKGYKRISKNPKDEFWENYVKHSKMCNRVPNYREFDLYYNPFKRYSNALK